MNASSCFHDLSKCRDRVSELLTHVAVVGSPIRVALWSRLPAMFIVVAQLRIPELACARIVATILNGITESLQTCLVAAHDKNGMS